MKDPIEARTKDPVEPEDQKVLLPHLRAFHDWTQEEMAAEAGLDSSSVRQRATAAESNGDESNDSALPSPSAHFSPASPVPR